MSAENYSRREALSLLGLAGATLTLTGSGAALAGDRRAARTTTETVTPTRDSEVITLEAALESLDAGKYEVIKGAAPAEVVAKNIICQFGDKYYSDERKANERITVYEP